MDPRRCTAAPRGRYVPLWTRSGKLISAQPSRPDWQFEVLGTLQLSCRSLTALATYWRKSDRTCRDRSRSFVALHNVRFWHKADIHPHSANVRFRGQSGHERLKIAAVQPTPEPHSAGRKSLM